MLTSAWEDVGGVGPLLLEESRALDEGHILLGTRGSSTTLAVPKLGSRWCAALCGLFATLFAGRRHLIVNT
jgi:hypothetical protein